MRVTIGNVSSKVTFGGTDVLYKIDFLAKLREYMRARPDGYAYSQAYKNHVWDGYNYFISNAGVFATGFLPMVLKYTRELAPDIAIFIDDLRQNLPQFNEEYDPYVSDTITAKEYQGDVVKAITQNYFLVDGTSYPFPQGIIDAAPNSGKTIMMSSLLAQLKEGQKAILLIDRTLIFRQLIEELTSYFGASKVGQYGDSRKEFKDITICMAKTLHNDLKLIAVKAHLNKVNLLMIDEAHRIGGKTYKTLITSINAGARIAFSGTPLDMKDKTVKMTIIGLTGRVLKTITNKEMIETGNSLKPIVNMHLIKDNSVMNALSYVEEMNEAQSSTAIINKIVEILGEQDKFTLITFNITAHGEYLESKLRAFGIDCLMAHGKDPYRGDKIKQFKEGKVGCLIASMIVKEGLNIPLVQKLIRAEMGMSETTTKQVVGRAQRLDGVSESVEVHDFYIEGKTLSTHSTKRIRQYQKQGFEVLFNYPNKKGKPV